MGRRGATLEGPAHQARHTRLGGDTVQPLGLGPQRRGCRGLGTQGPNLTAGRSWHWVSFPLPAHTIQGHFLSNVAQLLSEPAQLIGQRRGRKHKPQAPGALPQPCLTCSSLTAPLASISPPEALLCAGARRCGPNRESSGHQVPEALLCAEPACPAPGGCRSGEPHMQHSGTTSPG